MKSKRPDLFLEEKGWIQIISKCWVHHTAPAKVLINSSLTCSFPFAFFRKSSTESTACWKRFPLFILIISSLWAWYGFSCSTLIQALYRHIETQRLHIWQRWKHKVSENRFLSTQTYWSSVPKNFTKWHFLPLGFFRSLGGLTIWNVNKTVSSINIRTVMQSSKLILLWTSHGHIFPPYLSRPWWVTTKLPPDRKMGHFNSCMLL